MKKYVSYVLSLLFSVLILCGCNEEENMKVYVVCSALNVRATADTSSSSNVLEIVHFGHEFIILGEENGFYIVEYGDGEDGKAYISSDPDLVSQNNPREIIKDYVPKSIPKTDEQLVDRLMKEGQIVADFIRDMKFTYGDARINPGFNWAYLDEDKAIVASEKLVSCDRIVDWILMRSGFIDQPLGSGMTVHNLDEWCESMGFEIVPKVDDLQAGDIVFIDVDTFDLVPEHVFMCASSKLEDGTFLRYDAGSNERIRCEKGTELEAGKQPFKEPITGYVYAYRPNVSKIGK